MRLQLEHARRRSNIENAKANMANAELALERIFAKMENLKCCEYIIGDVAEIFNNIDRCQIHLEQEWRDIYAAIYEGRK